MKRVKTEKRMCPCCMEEHAVQSVIVKENNVFKDVPIEYKAEYFYCDRADETYAEEQQLTKNDIAMKNAYREKCGLLTSQEIAGIRSQYDISQSDLCILLGWGAKTITRYESHQVQDNAHDTILRKLAADPEWFLQLLQGKQDALSNSAYTKYAEAGTELFEKNHDLYLKSAIMSKYARYLRNSEMTGNRLLSLDVVTDMICYYANSKKVTDLYLTKLMKMLWYADALSYKRRGHTISGLVYRAQPMGAVPVAYESIVDFSTIQREEIVIGDATGCRFLPTQNKEYAHLTSEDKEILDAIIHQLGKLPQSEIFEKMHHEDAYTQTTPFEIIQFKHTLTLSLS